MAALLSAPAAARGYTANALSSWRMSPLADLAELVVSDSLNLTFCSSCRFW
jgi:hypothetical protein